METRCVKEILAHVISTQSSLDSSEANVVEEKLKDTTWR